MIRDGQEVIAEGVVDGTVKSGHPLQTTLGNTLRSRFYIAVAL